nr:MAG TPA: hypothetical protein [Bacteriophage sp.]
MLKPKKHFDGNKKRYTFASVLKWNIPPPYRNGTTTAQAKQ